MVRTAASSVEPRDEGAYPWRFRAWIGAIALAALTCWPPHTLSAPSHAPTKIVRVQSPWLALGVDGARGRIVEFVDLASRQNFGGARPASGGLWELEFSSEARLKPSSLRIGHDFPSSPLLTVPRLENPPDRRGEKDQGQNFTQIQPIPEVEDSSGSPLVLSPTNATTCDVETLADPEPGLRLTWSGFGLPDAPDLRVVVHARLDLNQPSSRWTLALDNPGPRPLARLRFPRVLDLPPLERECLVLPYWAGSLARNPRTLFGAGGGGRREIDYPGHASLQCLAYYAEDGPGLYVACHDTAGYRKLLAAFSEKPTDLNLELVHLPERAGTVSPHYTLPYATVLGTFQGDWFDAATRYRAWATNQVWTRESRRAQGNVPAWIKDTGLWIWNRGRSPHVLDPALALQRELGLPVSVFWHWWHGCAYDTGFPEYLPPREGDDAFRAALQRAQAGDVRCLVYMNQRLWGMTTASWTNENAARYAVKNPHGQVQPEVYNRFSRLPCATMCLGTEFWRNKYAGLAVEALLRLGVDGIYMDQACSSLACFDPRHGHPLGGGTYWMKGFQTLAADIRQRTVARTGVALAGEGCAENWLPHLDLMLALEVSRERYAAPDGWEAIPFFHAVYHPYSIFFGNYSSLTLPPYDELWPPEFAPAQPLQLLDRRFSPQFRLEQARAFIWGQQPTIANLRPSHLRERPEEIAFALRLAQVRRRALKYLQDGLMLAPPKVETPRAEIPMSRLSIYAGQQEALKEFRQTVPLGLASAWRAPDGSVAIAVVNLADRPISPTLTLDAADWGLPPGIRFYPLDEPASRPVTTRRGEPWILQPELAARDGQVFEAR